MLQLPGIIAHEGCSIVQERDVVACVTEVALGNVQTVEMLTSFAGTNLTVADPLNFTSVEELLCLQKIHLPS
jgi:hypothetical protein